LTTSLSQVLAREPTLGGYLLVIEFATSLPAAAAQVPRPEERETAAADLPLQSLQSWGQKG